MRVVKEPEERRQEIVNTAIRVFSEKGYEKTSMSDIAKALHVSQGLCYRYFPSKESIYDTAIDEYADFIYRQNVGQTHLEGKPIKEQILLMAGNYGKYCESEKEQYGLYELFHKDGNWKLHQQLSLKIAEKLVPHVESILKSAVDRGEIKISDPKTVACLFVYGQIGMISDRKMSNEEKAERIQKTMLEILNL